MAQKKKKQDEELLVNVGDSLSKAERFFEENGKIISGIAIALFVVIGGYFAYQKLYQEPREEEAQEEIFRAQQLFKEDAYQDAVNGTAQHAGFLDIAADYSGTKAGNMANYYAGISYLNMGEYQKAITLLDEFSTNDPILSVMAKGAIGDAFLELDQPQEAADYYRQAVKQSDNSLAVPFYLHKAAVLAESQGEYDKALSYYQRIKEEYPDSKQGADIDKFINFARTKVQNEE